MRHIPQRTCVACRTTGDKRGLIRVVRLPDGQTTLDTTGRVSGRGAYLCRQNECLILALKKKLLDRSLKVSLSEETIEMLREKVAEEV